MLNRVREDSHEQTMVAAKSGVHMRTARHTTLGALLLSLGLLGVGCHGVSERRMDDFTPQVGDLLFQDLDAGPLCDAIEQVTAGYDGTNLSHVGLVATDANENLVVIEAVSAGVVATSLSTFLGRSLDNRRRPKVLVGRLNPALVSDCNSLLHRAVARARALEGKAYDKQFLIGNDSYYCSELIYEAFRRANDGRPLFTLQPMTFKEPGKDEPFAAWRAYFARLGAAIPEGCPGINPGSLSRSPVLTIIHEYGAVTRKPTASASAAVVEERQ
jgi:hypothetical protein